MAEYFLHDNPGFLSQKWPVKLGIPRVGTNVFCHLCRANSTETTWLMPHSVCYLCALSLLCYCQLLPSWKQAQTRSEYTFDSHIRTFWGPEGCQISHTQRRCRLSRDGANAFSGKSWTETTVCLWTREACKQDTFRPGDKKKQFSL